MKTKERKLPNREKILIIIYEMSLKHKGTLKYEDIAVRAFKRYPHDFQLRGYSEYPDTEHMSKRVYDLRRDGFIKVHSKFITLTEKGKTYAKKLIKSETGVINKCRESKALSRDIVGEIERIKNTEVFQLFVTNKKEQILDTDFFTYLGTTVRSERMDFRARIKTIQDIIEVIKTNDEHKTIVDLHNYLFEKFNGLIETKLSIGPTRRKHE